MIRLFTALCNSLLEIVSDEDGFIKATDGFIYYDKACPHCGAVGKMNPHGDYTRGCTYSKSGKVIDTKLKPCRFKCDSCKVTHSLLPDIIIPYGRYSLSFTLIVLIAYFERNATVVEICAHFGVAVSTLYDWKKRLLYHQELMLGLLISMKKSALEFLQGLFRKRNLSESLRDFFHKYGFSFMQRRSQSTSQNHPP